jgi:hypothetical protein
MDALANGFDVIARAGIISPQEHTLVVKIFGQRRTRRMTL